MFVVCGEALIDIFIENTGNIESNDPNSFPLQAYVGGSPFNVAIGLAKLDQPSALLAGISTDMFGQRLLSVLKDEGVSQRFIVEKSEPTTIAFIEKDEAGVPSYSFYGQNAADISLTTDDINDDFESVIGIHLGSYTIVAEPTASTLLELVKKQTGKCLISLDPNIRAIVEPDMGIWQNKVEELVKLADIVKVSDEDLALLYPGIEPEVIAERWIATGLKLLALTRGGEGSTIWSQDAKAHIDTPKVEVIDTVGAGDTFQAALLDSISILHNEFKHDWSNELSSEGLKKIGNFAASAAAITCSRQGADLPRKAEIDTFMQAIQK